MRPASSSVDLHEAARRRGRIGAARASRVLALLLGLVCGGGGTAQAFTIAFDAGDFGAGLVSPVFSDVRDFELEIDFAPALEPGRRYTNQEILLVEYRVEGFLSLNPPTPSGFPAFRLDRRPGGEGPISRADWLSQGSAVGFGVTATANLADGLQLSELVDLGGGLIFSLDAREFERLDRARYHPPQLLLYADGRGRLQNSNNSSGSTGTLNPATRETVDVDFGEEYITDLSFDPSAITLVAPGALGPVVPEPGTALLLGLGLAALSLRRDRAAGP